MTIRDIALAICALTLVAGCTSNAGPGSASAEPLTVSATDTACVVSATTAPSGTLTFEVTNDGSSVTEFYFLTADDQGVVGEVENIGPGTRRELVVTVEPGSYLTVCKPGMTGDGIRAPFTVTESGQSAA